SYLITELLLREYRLRGALDVKAFYFRRLLRIWPLYFVTLFAGPTILHALDPRQVFGSGYMLAFTFLVGNWACAGWGYPNSALTPLWSVSIEEQFYLAWPLVMSRFSGRIRLIGAGLIVAAIAARAYCVAVGVAHPGLWCNT